MEWRPTARYLIGAIIKRDIRNKSGVIIVRKNTVLNEQMIEQLLNHEIEKVFVSIASIDKELEFQIETYIQKSEQPLFWESYISLIQDIKIFFTLVKKHIFSDEEIKKVTESLFDTIKLLQNQKEFFEYAYLIRGYEDSLYRHTANVAILSYLLSGNLKEKPYLLAEMGLFHDIGKALLNDSVLEKPTQLEEHEKRYIQSHTTIGAEILKKLNYASRELLQSAVLHHEYRNGSGYPYGYTSKNIPLQVQMITVADTFDSICSDRVYKPGKTLFLGLNEIYYETIKGKLNPLITFPFIEKVFTLFMDRKIKLNTGKMGYIHFINPTDIIRPIIKLDEGTLLNLSEEQDIYIDNFA